MKKLTGGDPVNAKLLYRNPIEFDPTHTLFMLTTTSRRFAGTIPPRGVGSSPCPSLR